MWLNHISDAPYSGSSSASWQILSCLKLILGCICITVYPETSWFEAASKFQRLAFALLEQSGAVDPPRWTRKACVSWDLELFLCLSFVSLSLYFRLSLSFLCWFIIQRICGQFIFEVTIYNSKFQSLGTWWGQVKSPTGWPPANVTFVLFDFWIGKTKQNNKCYPWG